MQTDLVESPVPVQGSAFEIIDADPTLSANAPLRDELDLLLSPEDEEFLFKN